MSDITKCQGTNCPLREKCYRFTATSNEFRQSYFTKVPGKEVNGKFECEYYYPIN